MILVYDIFGNLIGEYNADGTLRSEWVYLGNHRLAMITEGEGGGGFPGCDQLPPPQCGIWGDSVALNWAIIALGPFLIWAGFKYRRKPKVLLLVFMAGFGIIIFMIAFEARPNSESLTPNSESVFYYHNDHLGTPKVITDQNGVIQWEAVMEPFGEIDTFIASNVNNPFRFPGQYEDDLTGLYYNHHRYYIPGLGRYNRVDPLLKYFLPFAYSFNNSINYFDKMGLMCFPFLRIPYFWGQDISLKYLETVWQFKDIRHEGPHFPIPWISVYCQWLKTDIYLKVIMPYIEYLEIDICREPPCYISEFYTHFEKTYGETTEEEVLETRLIETSLGLRFNVTLQTVSECLSLGHP